MRREGKLNHVEKKPFTLVTLLIIQELMGQNTMPFAADAYEYTGEVDEEGKACGIGELRPQGKDLIILRGTFFNDKLEGIVACEIKIMRRKLAGEVKDGVLFGKMTMNRNERRTNQLMSGKEQGRGDCIKARESKNLDMFYLDSGHPHKALALEWRDFI